MRAFGGRLIAAGGQVVDVRRCQVEECPEKPVRRDAAKRADA